jgi:prepilin-type N-terminal cleavage/methylation domain-containing protein
MKRISIKKPNLKDGFTIIEVVLVLAIAGLIFLMVFIALPALQRSQRDTQRRDDIARANTALTQFMANNRNQVPQFPDGVGVVSAKNWGSCDPANPSGFCKDYLLVGGDMFDDPDGEFYIFRSSDDAPDGAAEIRKRPIQPLRGPLPLPATTAGSLPWSSTMRTFPTQSG